MLNNEMKEITFKIAKKFKTPLTYQYKGDETEIYSFTNMTKDKTVSLYINSTYMQLSVELLDFNDKGLLTPLSNEITIYDETKQRFLNNVNRLLEISNNWKDFIDRLYCLSLMN